MKRYQIVALVTMDEIVEIEASTKKEAIKKFNEEGLVGNSVISVMDGNIHDVIDIQEVTLIRKR